MAGSAPEGLPSPKGTGKELESTGMGIPRERPATQELDSDRRKEVSSASTSSTQAPQPKISKLAALAASRSKPNASSTASSTKASTQESKPLSKLQLKMQEKQRARDAAKGNGGDAVKADGNQMELEVEEVQEVLLPTGASISSLFPSVESKGNSKSLVSSPPSVPGGSPFRIYLSSAGEERGESGLDRLSDALKGNSPDDVVLKARAGTSLGRGVKV